MKKFEKPIVAVLLLEDVDVITTSGGDASINMLDGDGVLDTDNDFRQSGSRGPWGENPWDE